MRRSVKVISYAAATFAAVVAMPGHAQAQTAMPASYNGCSGVTSVIPINPPHHMHGCFEPYGDQIWLTKIGGPAATLRVTWSNYLKDSSGEWQFWRSGECEYRFTGTNGNAYCDYDMYENSTNPNGLGGKGSRILFWAQQDSPTVIYGPERTVLNDY